MISVCPLHHVHILTCQQCSLAVMEHVSDLLCMPSSTDPVTFASITSAQQHYRVFSNVTLSCQADGTEPKIKWFCDGVLLDPTTVTLSTDGSQVTIHNLPEGRGEYSCSASNPVSTQNSSGLNLTGFCELTFSCSQVILYIVLNIEM